MKIQGRVALLRTFVGEGLKDNQPVSVMIHTEQVGTIAEVTNDEYLGKVEFEAADGSKISAWFNNTQVNVVE